MKEIGKDVKMNEARVGDVLPNGAMLIAKEPLASDPCNEWVIMAVWGKENRDEYVVWKSDLSGHCAWGYYATSIIEASHNYEARLADGIG